MTLFPVSTILLVVGFITSTVNSFAYCPTGCKCDDETLVVQCGEANLDVLPIALNPSIQRLIIKTNKIKTIDSSIQFYSDLEFMDLSYNHLGNIPQKTFVYQKKLQELHLNNNKIGAVSNKTFSGLVSLKVLSLRSNFLDEIDSGVFSPLAMVEEINLGNNRISKIDSTAFAGLTNLRILYLDDNILTQIPSMNFESMPNLAELYLGINSFTTIPSKAFEHLKGLSRLDMRGAGLYNISHESFKGLESLRILDISFNLLQKIPTVELSTLGRLEELYIGQNSFEVISQGALVGLKNLKRFEVTGALKLKKIEMNAFSANTNLEQINISSNKMLSEIQEGALSGLPHLRHVIFRDNALSTIAEGLFPWSELLTLDMSENPLHCDCHVLWLRNILLNKNETNNDALSKILCASPERLRDESLRILTPELLGCSFTDPRKQALIGALLVGTAATLTAVVLILYRCRHKIREFFKGTTTNAVVDHKEREYQKAFSDEPYISHYPQHPCSLGIHPFQLNKDQLYIQQQYFTNHKNEKQPQTHQTGTTINQNYYSHIRPTSTLLNTNTLSNDNVGGKLPLAMEMVSHLNQNNLYHNNYDSNYTGCNTDVEYSMPIYHDSSTTVPAATTSASGVPPTTAFKSTTVSRSRTTTPQPPPALPNRNYGMNSLTSSKRYHQQQQQQQQQQLPTHHQQQHSFNSLRH
ncbi:hypothetical protein ACFFRR_010175 [Megaselia abdita]